MAAAPLRRGTETGLSSGGLTLHRPANMLFSDPDLARRVEGADARNAFEYAQTLAARRKDR
jgi:hypothetical protein